MTLNPKLLKKLKTYPNAILTFIDNKGYPYIMKIDFELKQNNLIELSCPKSCKHQFSLNQKASLLVHSYNEKMNKLKQILLKGTISQQQDKLFFVPRQIIASFKLAGLLSLIRVYRKGKKAAKEYYKKQEMKPPSINYEPDLDFWKLYKRRP